MKLLLSLKSVTFVTLFAKSFPMCQSAGTGPQQRLHQCYQWKLFMSRFIGQSRSSEQFVNWLWLKKHWQRQRAPQVSALTLLGVTGSHRSNSNQLRNRSCMCVSMRLPCYYFLSIFQCLSKSFARSVQCHCALKCEAVLRRLGNGWRHSTHFVQTVVQSSSSAVAQQIWTYLLFHVQKHICVYFYYVLGARCGLQGPEGVCGAGVAHAVWNQRLWTYRRRHEVSPRGYSAKSSPVGA